MHKTALYNFRLRNILLIFLRLSRAWWLGDRGPLVNVRDRPFHSLSFKPLLPMQGKMPDNHLIMLYVWPVLMSKKTDSVDGHHLSYLKVGSHRELDHCYPNLVRNLNMHNFTAMIPNWQPVVELQT